MQRNQFFLPHPILGTELRPLGEGNWRLSWTVVFSSLTGSAVGGVGTGSVEGFAVGSAVGGAVEVGGVIGSTVADDESGGIAVAVISSSGVPLEQADNVKSKSAMTSAIILVCFIFYILLFSVRCLAATLEAGSTDNTLACGASQTSMEWQHLHEIIHDLVHKQLQNVTGVFPVKPGML